MAEILVVMTTCPSLEAARKLADDLVERRLAACVNVLPLAFSVYRWQGELQHTPEHLLLIKTCEDRYPSLEGRIRAMHPYELPEIVALDSHSAWPDYLAWVRTQTRVDF